MKPLAALKLLAALLSTSVCLQTSAATISVVNTNDTGPGSFRGAIAAANASPDDDIIEFDAAVFGSPQTITLTSGQLVIVNSGALAVQGPGANLLKVQNGAAPSSASRVFFIKPIARVNGSQASSLTRRAGILPADCTRSRQARTQRCHRRVSRLRIIRKITLTSSPALFALAPH